MRRTGALGLHGENVTRTRRAWTPAVSSNFSIPPTLLVAAMSRLDGSVWAAPPPGHPASWRAETVVAGVASEPVDALEVVPEESEGCGPRSPGGAERSSVVVGDHGLQRSDPGLLAVPDDRGEPEQAVAARGSRPRRLFARRDLRGQAGRSRRRSPTRSPDALARGTDWRPGRPRGRAAPSRAASGRSFVDDIPRAMVRGPSQRELGWDPRGAIPVDAGERFRHRGTCACTATGCTTRNVMDQPRCRSPRVRHSHSSGTG